MKTTYHITRSLAEGRKPRESIDVIKKNGWIPLETPIELTGVQPHYIPAEVTPPKGAVVGSADATASSTVLDKSSAASTAAPTEVEPARVEAKTELPIPPEKTPTATLEAQAKLSGDGFTLAAQVADVKASNSPILKDMGEVWSPEKYKVARDPVNVGGVDDLSTFSKPGAPEVRNMLIKLPGKGQFEVPAELAQFKGALQKIVDHERSVNPNMDEYYAYVTVDQGAFKAGQAPGGDTALHYDGLQGADVKEKVLPSHSYEVSDNGPTGTTFHPIGIDFSHFPDDKFDWNSVLQRQASRDVTPTMRARPGEIYLSDAYTARAASTASEDGTRTALRVEFSQSRHATDGDTINPLLKDKPGYQWDFTPKPPSRV